MNKTQKLLVIAGLVVFAALLNAARIQFFYGTETGRGILVAAWEYSTLNYGKLEVFGAILCMFGIIGAFKVWRQPIGGPISGWNNFGYGCLLLGKATFIWAILGMQTARDMNLLK